MADNPTAHIIQSLVANLLIAVAKGVAAVLTKSGALMAETLHSAADCGNQLLLLFGVKRSQKGPDATHPLGYGRALYFYSFLVAMLLFLGGGGFSIYEGIHKVLHPEPVTRAWIGMLILGFSLVVEGWATYGNIRELDRRRGETPFWRYLRETKDSDLVVIFGENSAAVLGLALALLALLAASVTGDGRFDGVGSLAIGAVLVAVALFLAIEVKSLLVGERADPAIDKTIHELADSREHIEKILTILSVQQGPGEVVIALKIRFTSDLPAKALCQEVNEFEDALRTAHPEVRWCFVEPALAASTGKAGNTAAEAAK